MLQSSLSLQTTHIFIDAVSDNQITERHVSTKIWPPSGHLIT
jgi:hypothetical protein